jgi:hypothetical protein
MAASMFTSRTGYRMKPSLQLKIAALLGYVLLCTFLLTAQPDDAPADDDGRPGSTQMWP